MRVVGIDPGKTGALAHLNGGTLHLVDLRVAVGELDGQWLFSQLRGPEAFDQAIDAVFMEATHAMPGNGSKGNFSSGFAQGAIVTAVRCAGIPLYRVPPATWKRKMGLWGKDKNRSRDLAVELWPEYSQFFKLVKDHNRAEAALIARYGLLHLIHEENAS